MALGGKHTLAVEKVYGAMYKVKRRAAEQRSGGEGNGGCAKRDSGFGVRDGRGRGREPKSEQHSQCVRGCRGEEEEGTSSVLSSDVQNDVA